MKDLMKVRQLENKNQFILESDKKIIFQSYDSIIAIVDKDTRQLTFGCDWDYSKTTLKHLYIFLRDVAFYDLSQEIKTEINNAMSSNNKRKYLQKLIDKDVILYESELI